MQYDDFIDKKKLTFNDVGFEPKEISKKLYPFQADITRWALRKGRACLFEFCGAGKTFQQLEWARQVLLKTKSPILIVAPLAVAEQTKLEGVKLDVPVNICKSQDDIKKGVNITNYERLHKFHAPDFSGVVLDESGILKAFSGTTRNQIIDMFAKTPYKLACTATPSPNDYMELGNHAEFLGVMTYAEMLSMFFVNDGFEVRKWRLKRHAEEQKFWKWMCSWSVMLSHPRDLGYEQVGFDLPDLQYFEHKVPSVIDRPHSGFFTFEANTLDERRQVRKESIEVRCQKVADLVNATNDQWVIWCGLNRESELLTELIKDSVEVIGSQDYDKRLENIMAFTSGKVKRLITKPSIAGFGMNWQHCHKQAFVGLSDSWEELYQAIRRIWRYGQKYPVEVHIIIEEREGAVLKNIKRKDAQAQHMMKNMILHTQDLTVQEVKHTRRGNNNYNLIEMETPKWMNTSL
jgi:hypothetical protein